MSYEHCLLIAYNYVFLGRDKQIIQRDKCSYSELFWSSFSRIWTEYSVQMRENADQNNSEYEHFLRSVTWFIPTLRGGRHLKERYAYFKIRIFIHKEISNRFHCLFQKWVTNVMIYNFIYSRTTIYFRCSLFVYLFHSSAGWFPISTDKHCIFRCGAYQREDILREKHLI